MTPLGWFLLLVLIADFGVHLAADALNLRCFKDELPPEAAAWYTPERYAAAREYLVATTRFEWISGLFDFIVLLVFWFAGGFNWLEIRVVAIGWSPVVAGTFYIAALALGRAVIGIPFDIWQTYVLEARYGFNRTTPGTFILDRLKAVGLAALIGGPLVAMLLWFFRSTGADAWWLCWIAVTLFSLGLQYVAPTWIMPLFNRFEPLADGTLRETILDYATGIDFPLKNVMVMDGSKRSAKSNAFFTGFGRHRRIVLFDTLIGNHDDAELIGVLAHEMGHYKRRHILKLLALSIGYTGILFYLLSYAVAWPPLFHAFFMPHPVVHAGLIFFALLYAPVDLFLGIGMKWLSRRHEYEADRFAADTTRDPAALARALKKLSVDNLGQLTPHPFYVALNYSHPPVLARIRALEGRPPD